MLCPTSYILYIWEFLRECRSFKTVGQEVAVPRRDNAGSDHACDGQAKSSNYSFVSEMTLKIYDPGKLKNLQTTG